MKNPHLKNLVLAAMFLAMGMVLPFLTAQIETFGESLLPLHLPVMLCGLVCGWKYGAAVGLTLPLLRSLCFARPRLYPDALVMTVELFAYGLIIGLLYAQFRKKNLWAVYGSLIPAMIGGRILWGIAKTVFLGLQGTPFTLTAFWVSGFTKALPGIVLQLILIPSVMAVVQKINTPKKQ